MKYVPLLVAGALSAGAIGCGVIVRSILRPNGELAFKDYGSPADHGLAAQPVELPGSVHGWYADAPGSELAVLLVHGRSRASGWMYPIAQRLFPHASVMAIDLPGHGASPKGFVSYGVRESKAVADALRWLENAQQRPIVVVGVSMGGASSILALANEPSERVAAMVTIGTYADIASVFRRLAKNMRLPWSLARPMAGLAGKIGGFDLHAHRPLDAVTRLNVPYLAIQGDQDELVPTSAAMRLAAAAKPGLARAAYYRGEHDNPSHVEMLEILQGFIDDTRTKLSAAAPATA